MSAFLPGYNTTGPRFDKGVFARDGSTVKLPDNRNFRSYAADGRGEHLFFNQGPPPEAPPATTPYTEGPAQPTDSAVGDTVNDFVGSGADTGGVDLSTTIDVVGGDGQVNPGPNDNTPPNVDAGGGGTFVDWLRGLNPGDSGEDGQLPDWIKDNFSGDELAQNLIGLAPGAFGPGLSTLYGAWQEYGDVNDLNTQRDDWGLPPVDRDLGTIIANNLPIAGWFVDNLDPSADGWNTNLPPSDTLPPFIGTVPNNDDLDGEPVVKDDDYLSKGPDDPELQPPEEQAPLSPPDPNEDPEGYEAWLINSLGGQDALNAMDGLYDGHWHMGGGNPFGGGVSRFPVGGGTVTIHDL